MMKQIFTYLLLLLVAVMSNAQSTTLETTASSELEVCQTVGTNTCKIFNTSSSTLNNVQIGLKIPKGITYENGSLNETTNKNLSINRVTADSGLVFSSSNLAPGDSIVFAINYAANTAAIEEQNNGTIFRNTLSVNHSNGNNSKNSNSYNILYPVLAIVSTTPKNQTIISGTATSRIVKIINGGNGRVSSLWLSDVRNGSEVTLDSCSIGSLSGDSILLTAAQFQSVGNGDNYLDQNESIEVTQYLSGTSCTDKTITSTLKAHWGCDNNLISSSRSYSSISIDFKTPNLVMTTSENFGSCFGSGIGYEQGLTIINNGTGVASNVVVDIYKSKGSTYNQDILSRVDVSSLRYKIGINGTPLAPSNPTTTISTGATLAALGANPIGRVEFTAGNINPQDTMYVTWDMISACISGCSNQPVKGWKAELEYSDICNVATYSTNQNGQDDNEQYASIFSEAPADIFNNTAETYSFLISSFKNTLPSGPGAHYKATFTSDSGLDYNDLTLTNNGIQWTPTSIIYNASSRTVTATYPLPAPFTINKSEFNLKLDGTCGANGWKNITMNLYYIADTSCTSTCAVPLICNYQTSTYLHCPGTTCDGLSFNSFTINRNNFGTPDNNLDGLPDASGSLDFNQVKTNRAMVGDTIVSVARAIVSTSTSYAYSSFSANATYGSVLSPISATLRLYDASSTTWHTVNNLNVTTATSGTSKTFTVNLATSVLSSINSSLSGFSYSNGDTLELEMMYDISTSVSGLLKESTFNNEFYVSNYSSPTSAQKKQCTFRNGRITILGYNFKNDSRNYFTLKNCTQTIQQNFGMSIGTAGSNYAGGNLFPYEYRQWGQVTEAQVTIPNGYSVENARIIYDRTVKTNSSSRETLNNLTPDTITGNTYTYDFAKHFVSGDLTKSDDGFNGTLYLTLAPTCTGVPRGYEDINWTFEYQKTDAIDGQSSGQITTVADKIRYTPAELTVSSMNPIQDANTKMVNWDYKIKNTTSSNAENVWVYLDVPTTLSVDSIVNDKTNTTLTAVNGFYEYGTISASQTADLTIYGTFSNCDTVDYTVHTGYSCNGYPTDFNNLGCYSKELTLRVEPKKAQYQVRLTDELMADPCQPMVSITADITSVEIAHMYDMKFTVLSTDTTKIKVVNGSTNFLSGTGSFTSAQNPTFSNGTYEYTINDYNTNYSANGIPGILSVPDNNYKIQFLVEMGTNYQPGDYLELQIEGSNACGQVLPTMQFAVDLNSSFKKDETSGLNLDIGNSWSASWGDYDNDGYDDLFVPINDMNKPNILYHNNGDGTFSKVTTGAIVTDLGSSIAGVWGDYDNDGYIDLFVANNINSSNKLYHNNGNGTFTSIENSPVVEKGIYSHAAAWADFNRDGNLDLVVSDFHPTNYNFIFLGDGNGGFTEDVTNEVALSATSAVGISWGDYDNDGDPDLFIANTNGENNQLFNNQAGVLTAVTTGDIVSDGGTSVGGTWGDYDNDGDLDLFVTNSRITEANFFYENDGDGTFTKITTGELVTNASASNGASWIDFDNDGYLDLMVANDQGQSNFLFRNNGNSTFTKLDNAITQEKSNSFGTSWADFDNDGDYDLIVANRGANANDFFINGKGSCTSHLPIKLIGCNSNKSAIGAMIKVKSTVNGVALWQTKDVATQNSAMGGQNSQKILFGLGDASTIDSVSVYWPSGIVTHVTNATVNNLLTITEQCGSQVCGVVYHDANGNGSQDSAELGIPNRSLTVMPGNFQVYTGADGRYEFFLIDGTYSLSLNSNSSWNQTSPSSNGNISLNINQTNQSIYCGNDFGNSANCTSPDLTISLGNTAMRRGLLNDFNVKVTNEGAYSTSSSVEVEITMSDEIYLTDTNYTSISTSNNLRTYTFSLGTIAALSDSILMLTDSVDVYATLNDTVSVFAQVTYGGTECNTSNNSASFSDIIVGSVDPNDKQVFVNDDNARYKMSESHDELLSYKIRFQNLGNYAARRVQIVDTLSTLLDWSTFQITGSSHDFKVSIANGVVTWVNERIELPSVEDNEEESNGYVTFNIAPKKGVAPYTIVHNVANIQFDRNAYIATNDASAVIGLGNLEINQTKLIVYPNPARESIALLLVDADQRPVEIRSIEVYGLSGNKETNLEPSGYKSQIDITQLSSGVYSLKVIATDGTVYHQKLIKI